MSWPALCAIGPCWPKPVMRPKTNRGLSASSRSGPSPSRSITPGLNPSSRASALAARRFTTSQPRSLLRATASERRPRCSTLNFASRPGRPRSVAVRRSTRISSAPMSASSVAANGAGPIPAISTMRKPASGPIVVTSWLAAVPKRTAGGKAVRGAAASVNNPGKRFSIWMWFPCTTKPSTINDRASRVSQLHDLSGRLPALLQTLQRRLLRASRLRLALGRRKPRSVPPAHDLPAEFDRFVRIGERLERGLEELKDIQWQIRENESRYRDLLDNQADVILRRDAQGRLTFVNRAFCGVFGLEREEVLGRTFAHRVLAGDGVAPLIPG